MKIVYGERNNYGEVIRILLNFFERHWRGHNDISLKKSETHDSVNNFKRSIRDKKRTDLRQTTTLRLI